MRHVVAVALSIAFLATGCTAPAALQTNQAPSAATSPSAVAAPPPPAAPSPEILFTPSTTSPSSGAQHVDPRSVTFRWERVLDTSGYSVTYDVLANGREICSSAGLSCTGVLAQGTSFSWVVVATSASGMTSRSPPASLTTDSAPPSPVITSPSPGSHSTVGVAQIQFIAAQPGDALPISYRVHVTNDATGGVVADAPCDVGTCRVSVPAATALEAAVTATDGILSTSAPALRFRTDSPPTAVALDPGDDGLQQLPLNTRMNENPATDPDGDQVTYAFHYQAPDGEHHGPCTVDTRVRCELGFPKYGTTYHVTITATDALGLSSATTLNLTTRLPVVMVHGWAGDETTFQTMAGKLQQAGFEVHVVQYAPRRGETSIEALSTEQVWPQVETALASYPPGQHFDVIAHSMGGLVSRYLIENPDANERQWTGRVGTLVMIGTPNGGSFWSGPVACTAPWHSPDWYESCTEMESDSSFLAKLNDGGGTTARYYTIAGYGYYANHQDDDGVVNRVAAELLNAVRNDQFFGLCHAVVWAENCDASHALVESQAVTQDVEAILGPR